MANKERKNELIALADEAIKTEFSEEINNGGIPENYNGQMAAFSVAIATSGLKPALAFYSNENSEAGKFRKRIVAIILRMYNEEKGEQLSHVQFVNMVKLLEANQIQVLQSLIIEYAIAAKLVLRTFKFKKNDK